VVVIMMCVYVDVYACDAVRDIPEAVYLPLLERPAAGAIAFLRLPAASCRRQERPVRCPMDFSQTPIKSLNTIHHRGPGQLSTTWLLVEMVSHADTVCLGIELKIS